MIKVQDLNLVVEGNSLIENLSLTLNAGEQIGLTGPSGCGKTTLLRSIVRGKPPDGSTFRQFQVNDVRIGYVPQKGGLLPWFSVRRNLEFAMEHGCQTNNEAIDSSELLGKFQLKKVASRYPDQISGGEYQRTAMICALASCPNILLVDELFTGVDSRVKWEALETISEFLHAHNMSLLLVSHDVDLLTFLCSSIHVIGSRPNKITKTFDFPARRPLKRHNMKQKSLLDKREEIFEYLLGN